MVHAVKEKCINVVTYLEKNRHIINQCFDLCLQVILSHGNARLSFPLPSRIQQSAVVTAVEEDGNIRFQVVVVIVQIYFQLSLDSQVVV